MNASFRGWPRHLFLFAAGVAGATGCSYDALNEPPVLSISSRDTRFVVREHMIAAIEMQLSGEPFAEAMGRDLGGYSRDYLPADMYFDPATDGGKSIDLAGFSTGIESYEYSKQPMNQLCFESGAGVSLSSGPLLDPAQSGGTDALKALRAQVQHLGASSNGTSRFIHADTTTGGALGWPGIWPTLEPFMSFDPTVTPSDSIALTCSITSDDDPGATGSLLSDDYECDASTLHLADRAGQIDSAISPGSAGWAGWKAALWATNYLQVMHDSAETGITTVADTDLAQVGVVGNTVLGGDDGAVPGTFLGSSDIEGFQAGMMLTSLDNQAEHWLKALTTTDGKSLGGFPDLVSALAYDSSAPLRWFPAEIAVTETPDAASGFPRPTKLSVRDAGSHLLDLAGMLGAYATTYALTDHNNGEVGGSQPAHAYFDGDPFPDDNQLADGEPTLHDRSLAMLRVALVDLARMHRDPKSGLLVDDVTVNGGVPVRGTTVSASSAAYALLALRTTRLSLNSQLTLYGSRTPDSAASDTLIDTPPISGGAAPEVVSGELSTMISSLADLFYDHLTDDTGRAYPGWDLAAGAPTSKDDLLDAHTAAARGLYLAYLASSDTKYRARALAVFERVEAHFYDPTTRIYRTVADDRGPTVTFTPLRFGLLLGLLRDTYELVGADPGQDKLATLVEMRVGRLNKLVLNGWDDRNGDQTVNWPDECMQVTSGLPRGGLQMAERTLTGETGSQSDIVDAGPRVIASDREHDCVPEISAVKLPAALADSITITITTPAQ